jgi:hypothetical protein
MPTERDEERRMAEWTECNKNSCELRAELEHPTVSRLHSAQLKLWLAVKAKGDKCHSLLVAIRAKRMINAAAKNLGKS